MPRKRSLPEPANGSTLPIMVGAVIYVRGSTKEQTENLSLPTRLRACGGSCRRQVYEIVERCAVHRLCALAFLVDVTPT